MTEMGTENRVVMSAGRVPIDFGGEEHRGWLPDSAAQPKATPIVRAAVGFRILETSGGYLLEWSPEAGEPVPTEPPYAGDTWHQTLSEALDQAHVMFGLLPGHWQRT
jgi:hypothetical protein